MVMPVISVVTEIVAVVLGLSAERAIKTDLLRKHGNIRVNTY